MAVLCAAAWLGGCTTAAPSLTRHLVRQGQPTVDLGGMEAAPPRASGDAAIPAIRKTSRVSPSVADVEATDPGLRDAVAAARSAPSVATHVAAAAAYRRLGIFDRALDHLDLARASDSNDPTVNDAIARIWRDWGLPGVGLVNAYRAVHAAPRSATPRHTLGTLLYALGQVSDAEASFVEAVQIDPGAWYAWQNLCTIAFKAARTQQAIVYCKRADSARRSALEASHHERD